MAVTVTCLKSSRRDLPPTTEQIEIKRDVSRNLTMDTCEPDFIRSGQRQAVYLRATHHHYGVSAINQRLLKPTLKRITQAMANQYAVMAPGRVPGNHQITAPGQRKTNAIEGFAAHYDGVAQRRALKVLKIVWQIPRQSVAPTDDAIFSGREHQHHRYVVF